MPEGLALIVKGTQNALFADLLDKLQPCLEGARLYAEVYYNNGSTDELAAHRPSLPSAGPAASFSSVRTAMLYPGAGVAGHPLPAADEHAAGWALRICPASAG